MEFSNQKTKHQRQYVLITVLVYCSNFLITCLLKNIKTMQLAIKNSQSVSDKIGHLSKHDTHP